MKVRILLGQPKGPVAQLGERSVRDREVVGSNPTGHHQGDPDVVSVEKPPWLSGRERPRIRPGRSWVRIPPGVPERTLWLSQVQERKWLSGRALEAVPQGVAGSNPVFRSNDNSRHSACWVRSSVVRAVDSLIERSEVRILLLAPTEDPDQQICKDAA